MHVFMRHVENWLLSCLPFTMSIGNWWILWQDTSHVPKELIWVICQSLSMKSVFVHHKWSVALKATAKTTNHEVDDQSVSHPVTNVEVLNWKISNHH